MTTVAVPQPDHRRDARAGATTRREREPAHPPGGAGVRQALALQRQAGNQAVAGLLAGPRGTDPASARDAGTLVPPLAAQRDATAPPRQETAANARPVDPNSYVDVLNGVEDLWEAALTGHGAGLTKVQLGRRMTTEQRQIMEHLRQALQDAYTDGAQEAGLQLFEVTDSQLSMIMAKALALGVPAADVSAIRTHLNELSNQLVRPAAYRAAHQQAVASSGLQRPDSAYYEQELKRQEEEFKMASVLAEETSKLTLESVTQVAIGDFGLGKDIFELVRAPGTLDEKVEWARKHGKLGEAATALDLVNLIVSAKLTLTKASFKCLERYAAGQAERLLAQGLEELAAKSSAVAEEWAERIKLVNKIGRVVGVLGVIADSLKLIAAIKDGNWQEITNVGLNLAVDIAAVAGPEELAPPLALAVYYIKFQAAILEMAADGIRWCKEESVREAAGKFVAACSTVYKNVASDVVGDVEILSDPTRSSLHDLAASQMTKHAAGLRQGLAYIGEQLNQSSAVWIGGQPALMQALGPDARRALTGDVALPDDPLTIAESTKAVFAGANQMASYVRRYYPQEKR